MRSYDYILAIISIVLLAIIGIVSLYGTGFSWLSSLRSPTWTETSLYSQYLDGMNRAAAPFVLALVVVLGLCIPKRLFSRRATLLVSGIMVIASLGTGFLYGPLLALGLLLATGIIIQSIVVVLTLARSRTLHFEREGFLASLGSGLLHLGFVVFLFDFILLRDLSSHIAIFWVSAALIALGCLLSFYSSEISRILSRH